MKTLNRPMFRYGGPIKEGVMNGIREPKRNGGSMMGNNEGPRRAALVGNPIYPKVDGRTNHIAPLAIGAAAMRFLPAVYRGFKASRAYKPFSQNLGFMGRLKDTLLPSRGIRAGMADPGAKQGFATGSLLRSNPGITLTAGGYGINKLLGKEPKPEPGKPSLINQRKAKIGMPENLTIVDGGQFEKPAKELTEAERIELENKARREKMDSYRKIMDIKGMSKDAAYKSLIDASKIIQEGGNLKKQLKDGSLIQKVTAAASKRFDKVSDTETALRSLVAKGEIDNEMNKEAKALARRKDELTIATLDKNLNTSFADNKAIATKNKILGQAGTDYAAKNTKGIDFRGNLIDAADFVDVITRVKEAVGPDGQPTGTMDESQIIEEWTNNFVSDKNVPDGDYTVGDAIVTIKDKVVQKVMR